MRMYEVQTGDLVRVYAEDVVEMWEKIAAGDYEFIETSSHIVFVGAEFVTQSK